MQAVLLLSTLSAITVLKISSGEVNLVPMTLSDSSREISIFGDKYYRNYSDGRQERVFFLHISKFSFQFPLTVLTLHQWNKSFTRCKTLFLGVIHNNASTIQRYDFLCYSQLTSLPKIMENSHKKCVLTGSSGLTEKRVLYVLKGPYTRSRRSHYATTISRLGFSMARNISYRLLLL